MKRLAVVMLVGAALLWAGTAFAQYSALEEDVNYGPYFGVGGLMVMGDNGADDSDSEFLPTVNLAGMTDYLAWQAFYGFGTDSTAWGGSLDWILASNFDECFTCPGEGMYWFGVGATYIDVSDLYFDANDANAAVTDPFYGPNLGFGYVWDDWMLGLYLHYLLGDEYGDQMAVQGMVMYDLDS